jgi:hypothetical protein
MSDNSDQNMENEKCCSKRHMTFRKADESLVCPDKT